LTGFGRLRPDVTIRLVICSVLFLLIGGQTVLAGFYFGLVNLVAERRGLRQASGEETRPANPTGGAQQAPY
jgi:hypothetical protein